MAKLVFGKGDLLRNEPQYPTKGYAPHSGRGGDPRRFFDVIYRFEESISKKRKARARTEVSAESEVTGKSGAHSECEYIIAHVEWYIYILSAHPCPLRPLLLTPAPTQTNRSLSRCDD